MLSAETPYRVCELDRRDSFEGDAMLSTASPDPKLFCSSVDARLPVALIHNVSLHGFAGGRSVGTATLFSCNNEEMTLPPLVKQHYGGAVSLIQRHNLALTTTLISALRVDQREQTLSMSTMPSPIYLGGVTLFLVASPRIGHFVELAFKLHSARLVFPMRIDRIVLLPHRDVPDRAFMEIHCELIRVAFRKEGFNVPMVYTAEALQLQGRRVLFETLFVIHLASLYFDGPDYQQNADIFRSNMWEMCDVRQQPFTQRDFETPPRVIFIARDSSRLDRSLTNVEDLCRFTKGSTGLSTSVHVIDDWSICQVVRLFATADAIVSLHGSQIIMLPVAKPGTVYVDIYPFHYRTPNFKRLAWEASIFAIEHISVFRENSILNKKFAKPVVDRYEDSNWMSCAWSESECSLYYQMRDTLVPAETFAGTLRLVVSKLQSSYEMRSQSGGNYGHIQFRQVPIDVACEAHVGTAPPRWMFGVNWRVCEPDIGCRCCLSSSCTSAFLLPDPHPDSDIPYTPRIGLFLHVARQLGATNVEMMMSGRDGGDIATHTSDSFLSRSHVVNVDNCLLQWRSRSMAIDQKMQGQVENSDTVSGLAQQYPISAETHKLVMAHRYETFLELVFLPAIKRAPPPPMRPITSLLPPDNRIRIVYLALPDFYNHVFKHHDRSRVHVTVAMLQPPPVGRGNRSQGFLWDPNTDVDEYLIADARHLMAALKAINAQSTHVIIDLAGPVFGDASASIMMMCTAPVRMLHGMWGGGTSGNPSVDYHIGDYISSPVEFQSHYVESLALVPLPCQSYGHRTEIPAPRSSIPLQEWQILVKQALSERQTQASAVDPKGVTSVFIAPQVFWKMDPTTTCMWAQMLNANPGLIIVLYDYRKLGSDTAEIQKMRLGIDLRGGDANRFVVLPHLPKRDNPLPFLTRASIPDVMLDTLLYNGHMTTLDHLLTGMPVISLPGTKIFARMAASYLVTAGPAASSTLARSHIEYLALGARLGKTRKPAAMLRQRIERELQRSDQRLFNAATAANSVERLSRITWELKYAERLKYHVVVAQSTAAPRL